MTTLVSIVGYFNIALFTVLAIAALREWRLGRGRAGLWAALTFGSLAFVADVGRALPEEPTTRLEETAVRLLIALLVLFPYFLYRFTTAFRAPTRRLERLLGLMTVIVLAWTFLLPDIPQEGEPRPAWFQAYLAAFLFHWSVLSVVVAVRLFRAARGQPSVSRRRMELLAFASGAMTVALVLSAVTSAEGSPLALAVALLATVSGLTFLLGLSPPSLLRVLWRRGEQESVQGAMRALLEATSETEVAERVLPPMSRIVGARAVALRAGDGRVIGSLGASEELLGLLEGTREPTGHRTVLDDIVIVDVPPGSLVVWRSPYAPFFGSEELKLLETLGALTALALDHAQLFSHEREARRALERADELKTNFIALAAHELRTPISSVYGLARTLHARGADLHDEQRAELEEILVHQTERMANLVEQLLDLSRLDAEAVTIEPEPLAVRDRVEEIVAAAASERMKEVEVEIPRGLATLADRNAFERIVTNLVVNALRYGDAPIRVTAAQHDRHFRLAVEDGGPGVPSELVPDLFERFTRGASAAARASGTGLGLAIARSYARAHGGDLIYEQGKPCGARFEFVLPRTGRNANTK